MVTSPGVRSSPTIGVILAGGRSRRFGSPKALARLGDSSMLDLLLDSHRAAVDQIVLIADDPVLYADYDVQRVPDEWKDAGPLGGVHAGLTHAGRMGAAGALFTPCDVPFVGTGLLSALLDAQGLGDAVLARGRGPLSYEPLVGWYSVSLLPLVENALERGDFAMHRLVGQIEKLFILALPAPSPNVDPDRALLNINTPGDLVRAQTLLHPSIETPGDP